MKFLKPKFWESRNNILAILLRPISLLFYFFTVLRKSFISPKKFKIPIICVGNIYVGGTGKTPISIMISNILKTNNKNPAIIKKYYKDHEDEHKLINNFTNSLILNKNRVAAIEKAERENFDVGILDDGFQDHTIKKTLNIIYVAMQKNIWTLIIHHAYKGRYNSIKKKKAITKSIGNIPVDLFSFFMDIFLLILFLFFLYILRNKARFKNKWNNI